MVKFILIKSPDEWATTKQACKDELVVYLFFFLPYIVRSTSMYWALFYEYQVLHYIYIYIYIYIYPKSARKQLLKFKFKFRARKCVNNK